jgi:kexin
MKPPLLLLSVVLALGAAAEAAEPGGPPPAPGGEADGPSELLLFLVPGADAEAVARDLGVAHRRPVAGSPHVRLMDAAGPAAARAARLKAAADPRVRAAFLNEPRHYTLMPFAPNDPYFHKGTPTSSFPGQWHLVNEIVPGRDARVQGAWDRDITGLGVTIGIVDDCLQIAHPDLSPNYVAADSWDFGQNDGDPSPVTSKDMHGTSVAGVAAARGGNGTGVTGAAPYAKLAGLRIDFQNQTTEMFVGGTLYHSSGANTNIKVKNHSYGYTTAYIATDAERQALADSAAAGTIHCFAAGNERGKPAQDSNKQHLQSSPDAIAVAAFGSDGIFASYSSFGANVIVTTPSNTSGGYGITTTDRTGGDGYNGKGPTDDPFPDLDYTSRFGGTSSATPLAAGVLALVKQAQPALDVRFAKHLLARTCDVVDPLDKTLQGGGDGDNNGSAWKTNAAGFRFNQNYGFGLINADALTRLARTFAGVSPLTTESTGTIAVGTAIPDNNATGVSRTFTLSSVEPLEELLVTLDVQHTYAGDLDVYLTSPDGLTTRLVSAGGGSGALHWTFVTHAYWGCPPAGTWTLQVSDVVAVDTGTWTSFAVTARMGHLIPAPRVTGITAGVDNGAYGPGAVIPLKVKFSGVVTVDTAGGTPTLLLETGAVDRAAVYESGSGTDTLTFLYTVAGGDTASDLDYTGTGALALNGGSITALPSCDATLALPAPGMPGSLAVNANLLIDTSPPVAGLVVDGPGPADIDVQTETTAVRVAWSGFNDPGSGVASYAWAVGTTPGGTDVQDFVGVGTATSAANEHVSLAGGATVYVTVRATDRVGLSVTATSDGVTLATAQVTVPLAEGYNLIGLPLAPVVPLTAESLAQSIGAQGGECTVVLAYEAGQFRTHPVGTSVENFDIRPGAGYFVRCTKASTWTVTGYRFGALSAAVALEAGYTLVALPLEPSPADRYWAESAASEINAQGGEATQMIRYEGGQFWTHPVGTSVENFPLVPGRGYFLRSGKAGAWTVSK